MVMRRIGLAAAGPREVIDAGRLKQNSDEVGVSRITRHDEFNARALAAAAFGRRRRIRQSRISGHLGRKVYFFAIG